MIKDSELHGAGMAELGGSICVDSKKSKTQLNMFQTESLQKTNELLTEKVKPTAPTPDYDMANRFFDALTGSPDEGITFQFFIDKKKTTGGDSKSYGNQYASHPHKKRPINFDFADKKQAKGCGVWAMVNAGDGNGRKKTNVVRVRAFFIDLDGSPWKPAAQALKPHMRVESSPGRWHLYWLVEDCELDIFKPIQQAIALKYNGDESCCDLPRVLRVPGFFHLKKDPVMTMLVEDNDFPRYTTQQVVEGLGLDLNVSEKTIKNPKDCVQAEMEQSRPSYNYTDKITGEITDLIDWAAKNPTFDIVAAIAKEYARGKSVNGKQHIICPFADEHTYKSTDFSTFIVNASPPDQTSFNIHCMHSHCAGRDRLDFLQVMFEKGWLSGSLLSPEPLELRNPLWVTLQVKEISMAPEWSILAPDERRIAWDLQFFAWQNDDGTIEDNDWRISKFLGMPEDKWLEYRKTLKMAGWLMEENGRITNSIVKREFDRAQDAYSRKCAGGQKGGLRAQQNRRVRQSLP